MWTAGFPEPKTFSKRVARLLRDRLDEFDIVHDNQVLGYGMLDIAEMGFPLITSIHHPITFDRRIDIEAAPTRRKKLTLRRWYGFLRMQGKVARSGRQDPDRLGVQPPRHRHRLRRRPGRHAGHPARRRRGVRPADQAARPGPHRRDGQRRRPDEGHRHAARGVRQAAHRARGRAAAGHQADAGRPHREADRPARHRRARLLRQRHQRRRAGRGDGLGRARLRAVALRGLLAAHRRADGLRDPAGGQPRRRDPRGRRPRRRVRRPGHPGRRRRAGARDRRAARRPRAPRADGPGRPPPGAGEVQLARGGGGHRGGVRRSDRATARDSRPTTSSTDENEETASADR